MNRVAGTLRLEELPDRADLHELRGLALHFLHVVRQLDCPRVALGQLLLEVALESEMASIKHERVDIAPHFGQMRNLANFAIEIRRGGNRQIRAYLIAARFR